MDPGEEDDDFGDFGGFEAADPILPNVAQVQATGVEASPSPWAVFAAGSSPGNVKPDLLCGQNRFPPVLDPSVPSSSADVVQNGDTGHHNDTIPSYNNIDGTSGDQMENFDDAVLANDILDGSFKSSSSQHSSSGATASDLLRNINSEIRQPKDSQSVDLVGDLFGASPGIVLIEDDNLQNDSVDAGETKSSLIQNKKSLDEEGLTTASSSESVSSDKKTDTDFTSSFPRVPHSPGASSQTSETHHTNSPILIDSLRKALQPKSGVDVTRLQLKQVENAGTKTDKKAQQIDSVINEEIRQARLESQVAIATVVEQYKELSKQCISQQEEVLKECKEILKKEQETLMKELLQKQRDEFDKALEEEKMKLRTESNNMLQEMVAEQKEEFDLQMEKEKENYERRLQEALEEERENCRKKLEESLEEERHQMNKKLEAEKERLQDNLEQERIKYMEEMKRGLSEEKEKNQISVRELLGQEKDHCRECVKSTVEAVKQDTQSYIEHQKQKDKVVRHRKLSSLDVFLETAKQQLNLLIEDNQKDMGASNPEKTATESSKLDTEKKDET